MILTEEMKKEIERVLEDDPKMAERILAYDDEAVRELSHESYFTPQEIIYAYEHNKIEELYTEAVIKAERKNLYFTLISENTTKAKTKIKKEINSIKK